jgi:hypothetical protein
MYAFPSVKVVTVSRAGVVPQKRSSVTFAFRRIQSEVARYQ